MLGAHLLVETGDDELEILTRVARERGTTYLLARPASASALQGAAPPEDPAQACPTSTSASSLSDRAPARSHTARADPPPRPRAQRSAVSNGRRARVPGRSEPNTTAAGLIIAIARKARVGVDIDPPEAAGLDVRAGLYEVQERGKARLRHPQVVDHQPGSDRQPRRQLGQVARVEVDLQVPARQLEQARRQRNLGDIAAAEEVDPVRAHACLGQGQHIAVGDVRRDVRHSDEPGPELRQRVDQVGLVVRLKGAGDDRAADHLQARDSLLVVRDRERVGRKP